MESTPLSRLFPAPDEKTITDVPHVTVEEQLAQESPLRRFRNPEELMEAVGALNREGKDPLPTVEPLSKSVLVESYVYRTTEKGISYARLGETQLPVRVMILPFAPAGITVSGTTLAVIGTQTAGYTDIAYLDITAPAAPKLLSHLSAEGTFVATRTQNNTLFFVLQGVWQEEVRLPQLLRGGAPVEYDYKKPTCACPALYGFTRTYTNPYYLHVLTADTRNPAQFTTQQVLALSSDQFVRMTPTALFLGYAPQMRESDILLDAMKTVVVPKLSPAAKVQYTQIVRAPDFLLTPEERRSKQLEFLRRQERLMSPAMQEALKKEQESVASYASYKEKLASTTLHKMRFEEGKLQYVTAATTSGTPLESPLVGDTEGGSWLLSRQGSGTILRTFDGQMAPKGEVFMSDVQAPQVRRNRGGELWIEGGTSQSVRILRLADLSRPMVTTGPEITMDARLIALEEGRALQVQKLEKTLELQLLSTADGKVLARYTLKEGTPYTRLFETLEAAYYHAPSRQLFVHMEERRGVGGAATFDGVMIFALGEASIEKKAEVDLRSGMTGNFGTDIRLLPMGEGDVAVLYGKLASLINTASREETVRRVLE